MLEGETYSQSREPAKQASEGSAPRAGTALPVGVGPEGASDPPCFVSKSSLTRLWFASGWSRMLSRCSDPSRFIYVYTRAEKALTSNFLT